MTKTTLFSVLVSSLLACALVQGSDRSAALSAERTRNTARIAAIDREAGPTGNELQRVLQAIDVHNGHKPRPTDTGAVAAFNTKSDQLNQNKAGLAARLQALQDEQDRLVARNKAIDALPEEVPPQNQPDTTPKHHPDVTPSNEPAWTKKWDKTETRAVKNALAGFQDTELKNWVTENVHFERFTRDNFSPVTANESTLRFKAGFFSKDRTDDDRASLLAFEAGKVFWNEMKDKAVKPSGETLEHWFNTYGHSSVTEEMKAAPHHKSKLSGLGDLDTASQFGYIFRAKAIELDKPSDPTARQRWDAVIHDFDSHIGPLLKGAH